jgi:hypothetical protein
MRKIATDLSHTHRLRQAWFLARIFMPAVMAWRLPHQTVAAVARVLKTSAVIGQYREDAVEMIRENPLKSVLLALGVGALLGFLLTRRV